MGNLAESRRVGRSERASGACRVYSVQPLGSELGQNSPTKAVLFCLSRVPGADGVTRPRLPLTRPGLGPLLLPKLRVAGSIPVVRFPWNKPRSMPAFLF